MSAFLSEELRNFSFKGFLGLFGSGNRDTAPDNLAWYEEFTTSDLIVKPTQIWADYPLIPPAPNLTVAQVNAASNPTIIEDLTTTPIHLTPSPNNKAFFTTSTFGDLTSVLPNWIMPQLVPRIDPPYQGLASIGYMVRLYNGDPTSGGTEISTTKDKDGSRVGWFMHFGTGAILTSSAFSGIIDPQDVWLTGFRYIGTLGTGVSPNSVSEVNGKTGPIVNLNTDDIPEGSTNLYFTDQRVTDSTQVQENTTKLLGIEENATADQIALEVPFTPNGDLESTDVQSVIIELRNDTDSKLDSVISGFSGRILDPVQSLVDLKSLDTTNLSDFPDKVLINVEDAGIYRFDRESTSIDNGESIIQPTTGPGRWLRNTSSIYEHNKTTLIQGGLPDEYNHLSNAELSKLAGIEPFAQVNPTPAEIKTAYESNPDTNAFTDSEKLKLFGISPGATANSPDLYLLDRSNHNGTQDTDTLTDGTLSKVFTNADNDKLDGIEPGAEVNPTALDIKTLYESNPNTNEFSDLEKIKLGNIEDNATADQIASEVPYDNSSGLLATDVQSAIDEVKNLAENGTDDQTAEEVPFNPDGDIASSNVQDALVEVRDDTDIKLNAKAELYHEHPASAIVSGELADARISESSILQHESSINHNNLDNYDIAEHRIIEDSSSDNTSLLSSEEIDSRIDVASQQARAAILAPVLNIATLVVIDTTDVPDKVIINVEANGIYRFDKESLAALDGDRVIIPNSGIGRWFKVAPPVADHNQMLNLQGGTLGEYYHLSSTELAKLSGIEDGATADLTAPEVKNLYESNLDTNEFSDAEKIKLAGISPGADFQTAEEVPFNPVSGIVSNDVQAAIVEINSKSLNRDSIQDGLIAANTSKISADGSISVHSDVEYPAPPVVGDTLKWDGSKFIPSPSSLVNSLIFNHDLVGIQDGVNVTFTTSIDFILGTTQLYINGLRQKLGSSYQEVSTSTIVLTGFIPISTDELLVDFVRL